MSGALRVIYVYLVEHVVVNITRIYLHHDISISHNLGISHLHTAPVQLIHA
jgi:hypothetical protein